MKEIEERRQLGIPGSKWEDNIKMGLQEVGLRALTRSVWLRIGNAVINLRVS